MQKKLSMLNENQLNMNKEILFELFFLENYYADKEQIEKETHPTSGTNFLLNRAHVYSL